MIVYLLRLSGLETRNCAAQFAWIQAPLSAQYRRTRSASPVCVKPMSALTTRLHPG